MILYTMMPEELIFPQNYDEQSTKIVEVNGISLSVIKSNNGEYQIERVLSTDPAHYLNQTYYPGQKIMI